MTWFFIGAVLWAAAWIGLAGWWGHACREDGWREGCEYELDRQAGAALAAIPAQEGIAAKTGPLPGPGRPQPPRLPAPGKGTARLPRLTATGEFRALAKAGTDLFIEQMEAEMEAHRQQLRKELAS